jgi:hypothetical protein
VTRRVTHFRQCSLGIRHAKGTGVKKNFQALFVMMALVIGLDRAAARNLTFSWTASASPDVTNYNVYYGTTSGIYTNKTSIGNVTTDTISNLCAGITYYFTVTAVDTNANESGFSNVSSFIVPGILTMSNDASGGAPLIKFPVEPNHWYEVQATSDLQSWSTIWQTSVATTNAWVQFADTNTSAFTSRFYRLILH